jgi:hypothetical protein
LTPVKEFPTVDLGISAEQSAKYKSGAIDLGDLQAELAAASVADVIAELERIGVKRDLPRSGLSVAQAREVFRGLGMRVQSGLSDATDQDDEVRRHVIASQRIEGIDARRHV